MKSYLIFLSRHKAYTAINVFGLSLSLMFVMLIGLYVYQEKRVGTEFPNANRIELPGMKQDLALDSTQTSGTPAWEGNHHIIQKHLNKRYPEIEKSCGIVFHDLSNIHLTTGGDFVKANIMMADSTFFSVTGIRLLKGNTATCLQNRNGVVLSERFARRLFGNKEPIGQQLQLGQYKWARFHVTGIMPDLDNSVIKHPDMLLGFDKERWFNYSNTDESAENKTGINLSGCTVLLLLREGATFVNRDKALTDAVREFMPEFHTKSIPYKACSEKLTKFHLDPNMDSFTGNLRHGNPRLVAILLIATLVLLLFAVINYINLTVALSGRRAREMATRQLFGAPRGTIIAKMMGESTLLCLLAYVVALGLAFAFAPVMNQLLYTQLEVAKLLKPLPLLLTLVAVGVIGLISGVIPCMVTSRVKPIEIIKGTFRRQSKMVLGKAFIIFQNVITITMLGVAFVMIAQTRHLINAPMGYNTDNLLVVSSSSFEDTVAVDRFKQLLSQQACVERVSASYGTPMNGGNNNTLEGCKEMVSWQFIVADSAFMDIYGIRPINGSRPQVGLFYMNKLGETTCRDIMNMEPRELLKKVPLFRTDSNAVYGGRMTEFRVRTILEAPHPLLVYCAKKVANPWNITIQLKGDPVEGYQTVADIFHTSFHSQMPSDEARFADQQLQDKFMEELQSARITGIFALMAILVSVLGLIAMSTFYIRQRAHDIAIRKVFGSTGMQVRSRLVGTFMRYIVVAIVIADQYSAADGYLKLMGMKVIEGRGFTEPADSNNNEVMVSRQFVSKFHTTTHLKGSVVGQRILVSEHSDDGKVFTICGVYEDVKIGSALYRDPRPSILFHSSDVRPKILVKFRELTVPNVETARERLQRLFPDHDVSVTPYSMMISDAYHPTNSFRVGTLVTGITALIIALMGLIGYTNDEVNRRSKEIAIRKVNGATASDIRHLLVGDVLKLAIPAIVVGAVIAYLVTAQWLQMFSDRIQLNPLMFVGVAIAIVVVIVVMLLFATQKTINGNPVVYLKDE